MAEFTRCKAVRFTDETWEQIEIAAAMFGITTSEYIRTLVRNTVARIDMAEFTRCKAVRFTDETWEQIEIAAAMFGITTSEYIQTLVRNTVARIDPAQVLPEEAMA
jgi:predicted DNA-binding protein